MARRIAFALLALAVLLSAAACKTPEPVPVPVEQIERRAATAYTTSFLCFKGDGVLLNVTHPKEWSFEKSDAGLDIKREGQTVGQIVEGSAEGDFTVLESHRLDKRGVEVSRYLELSGTDNYRLRYVYKYDSDERNRRVSLSGVEPIRFISANICIYFRKNFCNIPILLQIFSSSLLNICSI